MVRNQCSPCPAVLHGKQFAPEQTAWEVIWLCALVLLVPLAIAVGVHGAIRVAGAKSQANVSQRGQAGK